MVSVLRGPVTLLGFALLVAGLVAASVTVGTVIVARVTGGAPILAAAAALAGVLLLVGVAIMRVYRRRVRGRRWEPLHRAMIRDADTLPNTYLAQIHTRPEPATGGLVIATDLRNGGRGPLWLGGHTFPADTVVCFTSTPDGPEVRSWITVGLWRACTKHTARTTRVELRARRHQRPRAERQIHRTADQVVSTAKTSCASTPAGNAQYVSVRLAPFV